MYIHIPPQANRGGAKILSRGFGPPGPTLVMALTVDTDPLRVHTSLIEVEIEPVK